MAKRYVFITPEESKEVKPVLQQVKTEGPTKEIRLSAGRILRELSNVREDVDYSPLPGYQVMLEERDSEVLERLLESR